MTLMTYSPRVSIFDEFNKIFNGINTYDSNKLYNSIWQPAFDITEDELILTNSINTNSSGPREMIKYNDYITIS